MWLYQYASLSTASLVIYHNDRKPRFKFRLDSILVVAPSYNTYLRALEIQRGHLRGTTLAWCVATQPRKSPVQLQLNSTIFNICTAPMTLVSLCNDIFTFVLFLNILQQRYPVGK